MRFEVSETDFKLLTSVLNLLKTGGYGAQITREAIIRESGVSPSLVTRKIHNVHLKQKQLKENIV